MCVYVHGGIGRKARRGTLKFGKSMSKRDAHRERQVKGASTLMKLVAPRKPRPTPAYPKDAHGAFTLVGKRDFFSPQQGRMWLGGISAQRGY